jgi:hypothetical protein
MDAEKIEQIYLCPKCFMTQAAPGVCPRDGSELLTCRPGHPDDPCRRPLINAKGRVISRAPIWWLRYTVRNLINYLEDLA